MMPVAYGAQMDLTPMAGKFVRYMRPGLLLFAYRFGNFCNLF